LLTFAPGSSANQRVPAKAPVSKLKSPIRFAHWQTVDLYVQGKTVGLTLYPISSWLAATESFREDIESSGRIEDDLYPFARQGIVIGEPPRSGNVLMLYQGRMHYSDHDGGDDTPIAENFGVFLGRLALDPPKFLYDLGCYARYSDGQSDRQWIPLRYLHD
jgi:hypothetical protein